MRFLIVMGHMRSGSSLLVHLLNSHPDISGFGEAHASLRSERDLQKLYCRVKLSLQEWSFRERYVMDKNLHDHYEISDRFLKDPRFYFLFLIRDSDASLSSLYYNGMKLNEEQSEEIHTDYYIGRLSRLEELAQFIDDRDRTFLATHDQIIHSTKDVFDGIQAWLGLSQPLSEEYKTTPLTGKQVFGDSSDKIKSGRIDRGPVSNPLHLFPGPMRESAKQAYDRALASLGEYCGGLPS